MEPDLEKVLSFLHEQTAKQAAHFPAVKFDKVLSFMGTTSLAGSFASVAVCPILGMRPAGATGELEVRVRGPLPRPPAPGECITAHVTNVDQYQGYQVKTRALASAAEQGALYEAKGDEVRLTGAQTFTVHHSPYTMKFFEQIPFEEIDQIVGQVPYAIVAIGERANVSPRFVFHFDVRDGRLRLYHGDGLALKTYMNLKSNRQETRVVLDLDDFSGYALQGTVEEFHPSDHPQAHERICQGFLAGNWGKPSRTFCLAAERWERIQPTAAARRRPSG